MTSVPTSHHIVNTHSNSLFYLETNVPECDFDLFDLFDMGHQYIRDGYMKRPVESGVVAGIARAEARADTICTSFGEMDEA